MIEEQGTAGSSGSDLLSLSQTAGFALGVFLIGSFFLALSPILPDVARDLGAFLSGSAQLGYPGGAYGLAPGLHPEARRQREAFKACHGAVCFW